MQPEGVRTLLRRQPFEPFRVHMSNGQIYEIPHPELAAAGRSYLFVSLLDVPEEEAFVKDELLSYEHIVKLEPIRPLSQQAGKNQNGS